MTLYLQTVCEYSAIIRANTFAVEKGRRFWLKWPKYPHRELATTPVELASN
jgi:hypothetical protein